ncbi:peptidase M16 [Rickettsiales bacterium]|nr:peptidase M16 [Rickettsiales bacterium]
MTIKNKLTIGILLLSLLPGLVLAKEVRQFTLENGMLVVVMPDYKTSGVTHSVWYKVGGADDEPGKSGTAHFLEHLMFKGTKKFKAGMFHHIIGSNGGSYNAFTHFDFTAYYEKIMPEHLEKAMELEADRMRNLILDEREIELERKVVLEERRMRTDNVPKEQLEEHMRSTIYQYHPYGRPVIGWEKEILNIKKEDLQRFYNKYYQPSNAILVISGSIDPEEVLTLAQKYYGGIENTQEIKRDTIGQIEIVGKLNLKMNSNFDTRRWVRYYKAPSAAYSGLSKSISFLVATYILGEGKSSRLYRSLVIEKKLATDVAIEYDPGAYKENTIFGIHIAPTAEAELEKISQECDSVMQEFISRGISKEELEKAKNMILADIVYSQESFYQKAEQYGVALTVGISLEDIESWHQEKLQAVIKEEVVDAITNIIGSSFDGYLLSQK